jgi:ribosomal protein S6
MSYRKYITSDGLRYFWEARYVSSIFDLNPKALIEIERLLRTDEIILRFHTIRHVVSAEKFDSRSYKNPYL